MSQIPHLQYGYIPLHQQNRNLWWLGSVFTTTSQAELWTRNTVIEIESESMQEPRPLKCQEQNWQVSSSITEQAMLSWWQHHQKSQQIQILFSKNLQPLKPPHVVGQLKEQIFIAGGFTENNSLSSLTGLFFHLTILSKIYHVLASMSSYNYSLQLQNLDILPPQVDRAQLFQNLIFLG